MKYNNLNAVFYMLLINNPSRFLFCFVCFSSKNTNYIGIYSFLPKKLDNTVLWAERRYWQKSQ